MNTGTCYLTKEEVLAAARSLQDRHPDFTARDVWYELQLRRKNGKFSIPSRDSAMHFIVATLLKNGARSAAYPIGKKRYSFDD